MIMVRPASISGVKHWLTSSRHLVMSKTCKSVMRDTRYRKYRVVYTWLDACHCDPWRSTAPWLSAVGGSADCKRSFFLDVMHITHVLEIGTEGLFVRKHDKKHIHLPHVP